MENALSADKLIEKILMGILLNEEKARIAVVGPSTLDQDHTTLFLSDLLAGTEAELLVVDIPEDQLKRTYGSLMTMKRQMDIMRQSYPHLKEPSYIQQNLFTLTEIPSASLDFILDHSALGWIALNIPPPAPPYESAMSQAIAVYKSLIKPKGVIMIAGSRNDFDGSRHSRWQVDVVSLIVANQLQVEMLAIKDIDLRAKFLEIQGLQDKYGLQNGHKGQYYPCDMVALCTK